MGIMAVISAVTNISSAYSSSKAASSAASSASERASDLKALAAEEYTFNANALEEAFASNIYEMFRTTSQNLYDTTQGIIQQKSNALFAVQAKQGKYVASSSAQYDITAKVNNAYDMSIQEAVYDTNYYKNELIDQYATNLEQLAINKTKMEKDINYSLNTSITEASSAKWNSLASGVSAASNLYDEIADWQF